MILSKTTHGNTSTSSISPSEKGHLSHQDHNITIGPDPAENVVPLLCPFLMAQKLQLRHP
jgi:hypothetical protein